MPYFNQNNGCFFYKWVVLAQVRAAYPCVFRVAAMFILKGARQH